MSESRARLLVAEDNKVSRLLLTRSLELQGYHVQSAENGQIALQMLSKEEFDLLLLDINMPVMGGFEVLEQLVKAGSLRNLPVIVTSALEDMTGVVRCIELGADDYIYKPVNPVLLKARVNSSLEKKRLRDQQRDLVRRFATAEVAQDMEKSGFALGGKRVNATVMFSDIRDFTSMCETQTPEETIELLNDYYMLMFDCINEQGGVVNSMIGDGLMAVFGAPLALLDSALCASCSALEMIETMEAFNVERALAGKAPILIGIGIATGEMIAGYTGTNTRATYTCLGNTVNLAARLEAHTKLAGYAILIEGETCAALRERLAVKALGPLVFKGKNAAVEVFALTGAGSILKRAK